MSRLGREHTFTHASDATTSTSYRHAFDIFCAHISDVHIRTQFAQIIAGRMNIVNTHVSFYCLMFMSLIFEGGHVYEQGICGMSSIGTGSQHWHIYIARVQVCCFSVTISLICLQKQL